jgi:hypothetical protein
MAALGFAVGAITLSNCAVMKPTTFKSKMAQLHGDAVVVTPPPAPAPAPAATAAPAAAAAKVVDPLT